MSIESYTGPAGQVYRIAECPRCHGALESLGGGTFYQTCPHTGHTDEASGLWRCLNPECNIMVTSEDLDALHQTEAQVDSAERSRDEWLDAAIHRCEVARFESGQSGRWLDVARYSNAVVLLMCHQLDCRKADAARGGVS